MTDDHLKQLGRVTVNFQLMEVYISFFLWALVDSEDQGKGQILTSKMPFSRICDVALALMKRKFADNHVDVVRRIEQHIKKASQLEQDRNTMLHSVWAVGTAEDPSTRLKYIISRRKGFEVVVEQVSPGDIQSIADDMKKLSEEFLKDILIVLD